MLSYPIYIPSKGRPEEQRTADALDKDHVPYLVVVEDHEYDDYRARFNEDQLLAMPFQDRGAAFVRNWIRDHAEANGHAKHWQLDDNIRTFQRLYRTKRIQCDSRIALKAAEVFSDRYQNLGLTGLNLTMWGIPGCVGAPFSVNTHVGCCTLVNHDMPCRWRDHSFADDIDLCLQAIATGWCTVNINAFLVEKPGEMKMKGGMTNRYQQDGLIRRARALERLWPGVVTVRRSGSKPMYRIKNNWKIFENNPRLRLKDGIDLDGVSSDDWFNVVLKSSSGAEYQDSWEVREYD